MEALDGMRVAILVNTEFEQVELTEPRKALEHAGATTSIVSPKPGQIQGLKHIEKADTFPVDLTLDQARPDAFDAVLLPGGALNADKLRMEPKAREFVRQIQQSGKPIAVICHGPWLLVSSDLVRGRTLTSYYTVQDDIRCAGGTWPMIPATPLIDMASCTRRSAPSISAMRFASGSKVSPEKTTEPRFLTSKR